MKTPRGMRIQIGLFGRRNAGKSSLFNRLLNQEASIVSDVPGTTTDPVERSMELHALGPVQFIDTAGLDDLGGLGEKRVARSRAVAERVDVAILVADQWGEEEQRLLDLFRETKVPVVVACTKADVRSDRQVEHAAAEATDGEVVSISAVTGEGLGYLYEALLRAVPESLLTPSTILGDLVQPGQIVVLVVPIDPEAPRGRLILPQVQVLRDLLDHGACGLVVRDQELRAALAAMASPAAMVVTDSQAFARVAANTPASILLTSFSVLMARFKGDLQTLVEGARALDRLRPGARVLVAEACTHHPIAEDIGREKIPRWIESRIGGRVLFETVAGRDFPRDVRGYDLVIHCGACMLTRKEMLLRIERAKAAGVPITNYGLAIAACLGLLRRALEPFPELRGSIR